MLEIWCTCQKVCRPDRCDNGKKYAVCETKNCGLKYRKCENRPREHNGLELRICPSGLGVFATQGIAFDSIIGPYYGTYVTGEEPLQEYTYELTRKDTLGRTVYIDAEKSGGKTRFMNHSCDASAQFVQYQSSGQWYALVMARHDIRAGEEVTLDYTDGDGGQLWFDCHCGSPLCVNKEPPIKREPVQESKTQE